MKALINKTTTKACAAIVAAGLWSASSVNAADIVYGDFFGTTVNYIDVKEDATGYFQSPFLVGDSLVFNPTSFEAQASGGSAEIVDGTLAFLLEANDGYAIDELGVEEGGFYSLVGVGTEVTQVFAAAAALVSILEVDGLPYVGPATQLQFNTTFADLNLADDGPALLQAWSGSVNYDIAAAAASELGITGDITKAAVTINNQLGAISEDGSVTFIDKKGARYFTVTVPEPGTMVLLLSGGTLMALRRRSA